MSDTKLGSELENCRKTLEFIVLMRNTLGGIDENLEPYDALLSILPADLDLNKINPLYISLNGFMKLKSSELTASLLLSRYGNTKGVTEEEKK